MIVDIDRFKRVNDIYGHLTGDDVIHAVAGRLVAGIRTTDVFGRYGGEEFAILMPDTGLDDGLGLAERLRRAVEEQPVQTRSGPLRVTISIGVAASCRATERTTPNRW